MKNKLTKLTLFCTALLFTIFSCKDEFTEEDLLQQQRDADLKELQSISAEDSIAYLLAMSEMEYQRYLDSLSRADSIAIAELGLAAAAESYLPYSYEVRALNGSITSSSNTGGRTEGFDTDVTVTITQYGVTQTQTSSNGLFSFENIGVGTIHGIMEAEGFSTFEWTVDANLPYEFFQDALQSATAAGGAGGGTAGVGGAGTIEIFGTNQYLLDALLAYFNERSLGNAFPLFATEGALTETVFGRAYLETDLTNRTKEIVPEGTPIVAYIDAGNANFRTTFVADADSDNGESGSNAYNPATYVNHIFNPESYAVGYVGTTATDANGDYSIDVPASPNGLDILFEFSDITADKTFYKQTNGDVTELTRRNIYGPGAAATAIPTITLSPTVTFNAGSGATATVNLSGSGSISDINVTNGGMDFQGTPRVIILPPSNAAGTQATATATVANGIVSDITVTDSGSGYTSADLALPNFLTITEGAGATAAVNSFLINGGVADVVVTNGGLSHQSAPNVVFWIDGLDDGLTNGTLEVAEILDATNFPSGSFSQNGFLAGSLPTATANIASVAGDVASVTMTNAGTVSVAPSVLITSGFGADVTFDVVGGVITGGTINDGGQYYTDVPDVSTPAGAGGNADAVLDITVTSGVISAITIVNGGTGYTDGTYTLTVTPIGSGATGTAVWEGRGANALGVTSAGTIQQDNQYYSNTPLVVFNDPQYQGPNSQRAEGTAVLGQDGRLIGVDLTNSGAGYTGAMTISIVSGNSATATPTFADMQLNDITVTGGGSGYLVAPEVVLHDPTFAGSGATATATITNGVVTSIDITDPGAGYINGANVIILDPGTSLHDDNGTRYNNAAQANVIVEDGAVTIVEVYQSGDNYPDGTRVIFTSTKGDGVSATATVSNGQIVDVVVDNGGNGYVGQNYARQVGSAANQDPNVNPTATSTAYGFGLVNNTSNPFTLNGRQATHSSFSGITVNCDIDYGTGEDRE